MNKSILILDENSVIHGLVSSALAVEGLTLHHEFNPDNYVDRAKSLMPDLILISNDDKKSDYAVCRAINGDADLTGIPLILLTGAQDKIEPATQSELGIGGLIQKPFEASDLQHQVSRHLNLSGLSGSAMEYQRSKSLEEESDPLAEVEFVDSEVADLMREGGREETSHTTGLGMDADLLDEDTLMSEGTLEETLQPEVAFEAIMDDFEDDMDFDATPAEFETDLYSDSESTPVFQDPNILDGEEEIVPAEEVLDLDEGSEVGGFDSGEIEMESNEFGEMEEIDSMDEGIEFESLEDDEGFPPLEGDFELEPLPDEDFTPIEGMEVEVDPGAMLAADLEEEEEETMPIAGEAELIAAEVQELDTADLLESEDAEVFAEEVEEPSLESPPIDQSFEDTPHQTLISKEEMTLDQIEVEISEDEIDLAAIDDELAESAAEVLVEDTTSVMDADIPPAVRRMMENKPVFTLSPEADEMDSAIGHGGFEVVSGDEELERMAQDLGSVDDIDVQEAELFAEDSFDIEEDDAEMLPPPEPEGLGHFSEDMLGDEELDENRILEAMAAEGLEDDEDLSEDDLLQIATQDVDSSQLEELPEIESSFPEVAGELTDEELILDQDEEAMMLASLEDDANFDQAFASSTPAEGLIASIQDETELDVTGDELPEDELEAMEVETLENLDALEDSIAPLPGDEELLLQNEDEETAGLIDALEDEAIELSADEFDLEQMEDEPEFAAMDDEPMVLPADEMELEPLEDEPELAAMDAEPMVLPADEMELEPLEDEPEFAAMEEEPMVLPADEMELEPLEDEPEFAAMDDEPMVFPEDEMELEPLEEEALEIASEDLEMESLDGIPASSEELPVYEFDNGDDSSGDFAAIYADTSIPSLDKLPDGAHPEEKLPEELISPVEEEEDFFEGEEMIPDELISTSPEEDASGPASDLSGDFLAELSELKEEIAANPEGERLSDILAQEGIEDAVEDLDFPASPPEDTFDRAMGVDDFGGEDNFSEVSTEAMGQPESDVGAPIASMGDSMIDDAVKTRLSEALDEIIAASVRKAVQEEMPKLMERILKEEQQT